MRHDRELPPKARIGSVTALGLVFIAAAAVLLIADTGHLSRRLPTQLPPRSVALLPLTVGILFLVLGLAFSS